MLLRSARMGIRKALIIFCVMMVAGCAASPHAHSRHGHRGKRHSPPAVETTSRYNVVGMASWYGPGFRGRRTASGERFDPNHLTCAHRTLPFGTKLKVTNLTNDRSVLVRVNDRGPFHRRRMIDLSRAAAKEIGLIASGEGRVRVEAVE